MATPEEVCRAACPLATRDEVAYGHRNARKLCSCVKEFPQTGSQEENDESSTVQSLRIWLEGQPAVCRSGRANEGRPQRAGLWRPDRSGYQALATELDLGLLLPCNVVVYETEGGSIVQAMDPEPVLGLVGNSRLEPIAREVKARLQAALTGLSR